MTFRGIILATASLAILLLPAVCFADEMADAYQSIKPFFDRLNNPSVSANDSLPIIKCGTPYVLQAMALSPEYRQALGYTAATRTYMQELTEYFDSPGGHFRIRYTTADTSRHLIDTTYGDKDNDSVPDYAEIIARIADSVWVHHIDSLGYHEPPNDGAMAYGDGPRYDIFLIGLSEGLYGYTQPDEPAIVEGTHVRLTSWMALGNDYASFQGYADRPIEAIQVTVAHEFFHAIQFWYDAKEQCPNANCADVRKQNPYWMEMSAVWMEEETYDKVNDYYGYLPYYFPYLHKSLRTFATSPSGDWSTLYCYGAGVFPMYLVQRFGNDIIKKTWEYCGEVSGSNFLESAIQAALNDASDGQIDLPRAWAEYGRWLYFTGDPRRYPNARTRPGQFFEEAVNYPMVPTQVERAGQMYQYIRAYNTYPIKPEQTGSYIFFPDAFGFNYLDFRTSPLDSVLTFGFADPTDTQGSFGWSIGVMAFDQDNPLSPIWRDDELHVNKDTFEVKNVKAFSDIIVVPTLVNPAYTRLSNNYLFSVDDTSIVVTENGISYGPSKIVLSDPQALNSSLNVTFAAANDAAIGIQVFTVSGEKVFSQSGIIVKNGQERLRWDGKNQSGETVASGVYVVRAEIGSSSKTFKVLVIR